MAHAYFIVGTGEEGIAQATAVAEREWGIKTHENPDLSILRYGLFSVDDARNLVTASGPIAGDRKLVIISVKRIFHEAQNALLKLFEEPPEDTTLVLVVPSAGVLLHTLRSRLMPLPNVSAEGTAREHTEEIVNQFLKANANERKKLCDHLLARSGSDKEEERQQARFDSVRLVEGLLLTARKEALAGNKSREVRLYTAELVGFLPTLHTRSAPLKLILEHLQLVIPSGLLKT